MRFPRVSAAALSAILVAAGIAACAPVQKEKPPAVERIGYGIVTDVERAPRGKNASPGTAGWTREWRYTVNRAGRSMLFSSHATVNRGDCVLVENVAGYWRSVLTRVDPKRCE